MILNPASSLLAELESSQDVVLAQLDELNQRIELLLVSLRESEQGRQEGSGGLRVSARASDMQ
jgi:hypothetical protein